MWLGTIDGGAKRCRAAGLAELRGEAHGRLRRATFIGHAARGCPDVHAKEIAAAVCKPCPPWTRLVRDLVRMGFRGLTAEPGRWVGPTGSAQKGKG
jgi:hypothetical protein